ncbi:MAG: bifunctional folylpolyglutamate synthase/dihydrofolate synthase [Janthinobacterium lividum]
MQYDEALHILAALGPELRTGNASSTGAPPRKFTLEHIRSLLLELGEPQKRFRSVLIAGTNGKGSTAATLSSICAAAGLRTGLYTSPHLLRVNERMRVSGPAAGATVPTLVEISDADFGRLFGQVYRNAEQLVARGTLPHMPSFFELLTAVGFLFFAEQNVDLAVLEVGLGGRLDATNVVEPAVSVITDIGIDHTEFLGETITEIAREKAGILRRGGVLVTLSQHPEANAAIGETAVALDVRGVDASRYLPPRGFTGSPSTEAREPAKVSGQTASPPAQEMPAFFNRNELEGAAPVAHAAEGNPVVAAGSSSLTANWNQADTASDVSPLGQNAYPVVIDGELVHLHSPLPGHHQQRNLALAVATVVELRSNHGFAIPNPAIEAGVRATVWPGRLEWLPAPPATPNGRPKHAPLLLDVAHNPAGAWTLRAALAQLPEERPRTLIFSCLADKQIDEMARILWPLFDPTTGDPARRRDHILLAPIANPRAATVDQLLQTAHALDIPVHAAPHLAGALQQAEVLTPPDGIIVATGSVYLVGELRRLAMAERAR